MRRSRVLSAGKASALDDLARRKETGIARAAEYQVTELDAVYDQVDEATYAEIAALKRRDARNFLVADDARRPTDGDDDDDERFIDDLENEFAYEDELSMMQSSDRKRKRTTALQPGTRRPPAAPVKPVKRVAPAFFKANNRALPTPAAVPNVESGEENSVFDANVLDAEFAQQLDQRRSSRRRKKALAKLTGDMLFDAQPVDATETETANELPMMPPPPPMEFLEDSADVKLGDKISDAAMLAAVEEVKLVTPQKNVKPVRALQMPPQHKAVDHKQVPPVPISSTLGKRDTVPANAPLARDSNGDLLLFWTDAHGVRVNGGEYLYLFGKAPIGTIDSGVYASVCIQIRGLERKLYILPRQFKTDAQGRRTDELVKLLPDVYNEVKDRLLGNINNHRGLGGATTSASNLPTTMLAKVVQRSSPFCDIDAPREATEYLKVKIPYDKQCRLGVDASGRTFSRVYGTKTSAAEALALKRRLKGPSWIRVSGAAPLRSRVTHARHALVIGSPAQISVSEELATRPPPPLSTLCLSTKTVLSAKTGAHELVMVAGVFVGETPLAGATPEHCLDATRDFVLVRAPEAKNIPFGFRERANSASAGGGVEVVPNEPALLNNLLTKLLRLDPDVLVGHDIMGFGLDVLLARLNVRRSRDWSRLGRLVQTRALAHAVKASGTSSWFKEDVVAGRLVIDTLSVAKELLMREKDYSLTALSRNVLAAAVPNGPQVDRRRAAVALYPPTDVTKIGEMFQRADTLCGLVTECSREARIAGKLAAHLNVLPLTKQLTCISGNFWSRTLRGARAERIEYLLCHELKVIGSKGGGASAKAGTITTKLLLPDKLSKAERAKLNDQFQRRSAPKNGGAGFGAPEEPNTGSSRKKTKSARRKPQYSGGLVLEPKKGLYDRYVLQLDFNSLYPSIIQEFNICFTTLNLSSNPQKRNIDTCADTNDVPDIVNNAQLIAPGRSVLEGVLPRVLRRLIETRRAVKKALKQEREKNGDSLRAQQLETRQLAIKLTANSLYGCLGFENSRFFARPLAELVTQQGRETLQKTVDLSRDSFNAEVIYGDTDSIFVHTGLDSITAVRKLGTELKREVNKRYHTLEIEIDAIYKKMLLLKKKKYAALKVLNPLRPDVVVREVKGLDLVRHDWCDLSHDASEHFLTQIFQSSSANVDDAVANVLTFLSQLSQQVSGNAVALSKYVITRSLTKKPDEYPDGKNLPHVQVALRLRDKLQKRVQAGDYIKYVICVPANSVPNNSIAMRAYHPEEVVASNGELRIDVKYYLEHQVLPPVMRLAEPIESVERSRLAVALGLDGRRYERRAHEDNDDIQDNLALGPSATEAEKYMDVDKLTVSCANCGASSEFKGPQFSKRGVRETGLQCAKCHHRFPFITICNALSLHVRAWLRKYYCSPHRVNGAQHGARAKLTRNVTLGGTGLLAKRMWDEAWLYTQLRYLHFLMDVDARWMRVDAGADVRCPLSLLDQQTFKTLLDRVDRVFDSNAFRFVDIADFLAPLGVV